MRSDCLYAGLLNSHFRPKIDLELVGRPPGFWEFLNIDYSPDSDINLFEIFIGNHA